MLDTRTTASAYLGVLARKLATAYAALPNTRAILLIGSAAKGLSDFASDLDLAIYYDTLPADDELEALRNHNRGSERLWLLDDRNGENLTEAYRVVGVECQFAHITLMAWERDMSAVLEELDVTSPLQKALEGTLHGIPLFGSSLIEQWQARIAAYPSALAEAMVRHYLAFFPIWYIQEQFLRRDTTIWRYQILVESAQHILGVLAGLNRLYYSTFQFKRMERFIGQMQIVPLRLADRLEALFVVEPAQAIEQLEILVTETVVLVEQHMPQVDTRSVRARLGQRQLIWQQVNS